MQTLLRIGLSNAACAAALAMLAWGLPRLVRRPALGHALWLLVLIKLITPPIWTVPVAFPSSPPAASAVPAVEPVLAFHAGGIPAALLSNARESKPPISPSEWIIPIAAVLWMAGSAGCGGVIAIRIRRFRHVLAFAVLASDDVQASARAAGRKLQVRRVPAVWMLPGPICPMLWAVFGHSRLLLPAGLWDTLSPAQQESLLAHELAHLKRRDHWVRLLELVATVLYWWNPILWWARHELHQAEEDCCDAWVAWALPDSSHDYAAALVEAVEFASIPRPLSRPCLPALASGIGEFRSLKRRLIMIQQQKTSRTLGPLGAVCVCGAGLLLPLSIGYGQRSDPAPASTRPQSQANHAAPAKSAEQKPLHSPAIPAIDTPVEVKLNRTLPEMQFNAVGFTDVVDFLRDVSGANIFVDWNALEDAGIGRNTPLTADLKNVKFSKALTIILASFANGAKKKLGYRVDQGIIVISTVDELAKQVVTEMYDIHDLAAQAPNRTLELIQTIIDSVDPKSWKEHGGNIGRIRAFRQQLIVTQSVANQQAVLALLQHVRELTKPGKPR